MLAPDKALTFGVRLLLIMLFGTKETFAIEAISEPTLKPPSAVWGRMQIWCQGVPIGDFSDSHCALHPGYTNFKNLGAHLSRLWKPEFDGLSDWALLNRLDELLYGCHGDVEIEDGRSAEECRRDWAEYGMFNFLTNWGEPFDRDGKSFIFCTPEQQVRILKRDLPTGYGLALEAPAPQVLNAIEGFLKWFEEEATRLGRPIT
ncbi:MAG: hypothetical protein FWC42_07665 [Proteobacteria bacterium]|nr:hypothetical protein [Pseudomonadota bacterium]